MTNADEWFIKKGQIDSISRSHFSVGDEVVVCDRQHVMLAEFYDGECPTCHSKKLVPFCRENVEPGILHSYVGECPRCNENVTIIFCQHGTDNPFIGRCPHCKKKITLASDYFVTQKKSQELGTYIRVVNNVLKILLAVMILVVILLNYTGTISNQNILTYVQNTIIPRTLMLAQMFQSFFLSELVTDRFVNSFLLIIENTNELFENGRKVVVFLVLGLQSVLLSVGNVATQIYLDTYDLLQLFIRKTNYLINYFSR